MHKARLIVLFFTAILVATACAPQNVASDASLYPDLEIDLDAVPQVLIEVQTWLDAPLNNSQIPEAPYNLLWHSASVGPVVGWSVLANGITVGTGLGPTSCNTSGNETLCTGEMLWTPPAPGYYLIEVLTYIHPAPPPPPYSDGAPAQAYVSVGDPADSDIPAAEEDPAAEVDFPPDPIGPNFDTAVFYYGGSCSPSQIETEIMVPDPDADSLVMFYRLRGTENGQSTTDWEAMAMNPGSENYWRLTLPSSSIPDRDMFSSADFQVQIVGTKAGDEILRTDVIANQITLLACGEEPPPEDDGALPQCSDGIDNDGDGATDFGDAEAIADGDADRQCTSPDDNSE